jgi:protein gp37
MMSAKSKIEWTDASWNPVVGCQKVSEGCRNCYAKALHNQRHRAVLAGKKLPAQYIEPFEVVQLMEERLSLPLHWRTPRRIFVNSVSDLFHEAVPFDFIDRVVQVMREADWHTFQVLTKRSERMLEWYKHWSEAYPGFYGYLPDNLWLGVSVENQKAAEGRIPYLLEIPNVRRFVSCEPLLGPVNLRNIIDLVNHAEYDALDGVRSAFDQAGHTFPAAYRRLDWVIVGGESGTKARPMDVTWARWLRAQCVNTGTRYFFKQWGEWCHASQPQVADKFGRALHRWGDDTFSLRVGREAAGHLLDGREWRELP